jgi:spore coat polysaccharide biosynthesis protein SpsF
MTTATSGVRTLAVLQARLSSSRLPGKVLMPLGEKPMIGFMIERLRRARSIDRLVLATSDETSDDQLAEAVAAMGVAIVRGPLDDVLARFALASQLNPADVIVRLTGDCPLIDPGVVDRVVECVTSGDADYASNCFPPTYPDGLDCEAFRFDLLNHAAREARLPSEREHVTPYIHATAMAAGRVSAVRCNVDLSALRWTVDYIDDFELVRRIVAHLGERALDADVFDVLRAYDMVAEYATHNTRNEGYQKSLAQDGKLD